MVFIIVINNGLEAMWKEVAVAYFKMLSYHLTRVTEENISRNSLFVAKV